MNFIEYVQLNPFQKFLYKLKMFFVNLPKNLGKFFKFIGMKIAAFFIGIGHAFKFYGTSFVKGDWSTKISYLIMGFGIMVKGQIVKGIVFLAVEIAYFAFMIGFAWQHLSKFLTLGAAGTETIYVDGMPVMPEPDNSMLIMLFSVLAIIVTVLFIFLYIVNIRINVALEERKRNGEHINSLKEDLATLLD